MVRWLSNLRLNRLFKASSKFAKRKISGMILALRTKNCNKSILVFSKVKTHFRDRIVDRSRLMVRVDKCLIDPAQSLVI